jgi:negative regulator of flagellin synthesis FlgM
LERIMKIQGDRANELGATHVQANGAGRAARPEQTVTSQPVEDRIEVSADARLVNDAVRAANDSPDIRQDLVERAKQKLAAGELGSNPERLAERMIDTLLGY